MSEIIDCIVFGSCRFIGTNPEREASRHLVLGAVLHHVQPRQPRKARIKKEILKYLSNALAIKLYCFDRVWLSVNINLLQWTHLPEKRHLNVTKFCGMRLSNVSLSTSRVVGQH